ncbi:MAG: GspE/PulE family protein [Candidatus Brocadia sp.]
MAKIKLGELLIAKGLISEKQLSFAINQQKVTGDLLGDTIVKLGFIESYEMKQVLAEQDGLEFVDLNEYTIPEDALKAIPKNIAVSAEFIPLDIEDGKLSIGIINPNNIHAIDAVTKITKKHPDVYMVDRDIFLDVLEKTFYFLENPTQQRIENIIKEIGTTGAATGNVVASLIDLIIHDGIRRKASDIHINSTAEIVYVFYRIDGVLQHGHCIPMTVQKGIISRIKILSQIDIAEQRLPQDGSFSFSFLNKTYDIRVSTVPTIYGENVVMRILSGSGRLLRLEKLGFNSENTQKIKTLFSKPYGIILITGPTGSGKTTTLYSALREIDIIERNVLTVENPVEYKISLIKQTQVNEKIGYGFALAIRNFMRQDPDVILLGEIRDEETAKVAIRASITGHLVLSTLHSNDAITAIPRLIDLGVDRFQISSSLLAVISQRLVRKICKYCKVKHELDNDTILNFKEYGSLLTNAYRGKGCRKCNGTGYAGRTVIGEILIVDDEIRELIYSNASINAIKQAAIRKGMHPLMEESVRKIAEGITTVEEVMRVIG